jgi:putative MATE family efflux protein
MSESANRTVRLGEAPVGKLLLEFSIPAIVAMIANALYNVVDSMFVGRGVGPLALTAVTIAFPIMIILMGCGMLIGIGSTALVSIKLGQGRHDEAEKILGNAFAAIIAMGLLISGILLYFLDPLLKFLGATPDVFDYARQFTEVILCGTVFQFISFGINNIIRAEGKPLISMVTMLVSAAMNTLLNPLFIFVFHWGVRGSALATVFTQIVISAYIIYHFTLGKSSLKLHKKNLKIEFAVLMKIFAIGLAPFLLQIAASITAFLFNHTLLIYGGEMAIAAMGVISRTAMMLLMPIFGINQGVQPIIGFNYGAKKYDRVKKALLLATVSATAICVAGFAATQLFSHEIIGLFNSNSDLMHIGTRGIRIFLIMLPIIGFQIITTNYFQAVGKAAQAIFLSLTRQVLFLIPLILILPAFFNLDGIWIAGPLSDLLAAVVAGILLFKELRHLDERHEATL